MVTLLNVDEPLDALRRLLVAKHVPPLVVVAVLRVDAVIPGHIARLLVLVCRHTLVISAGRAPAQRPDLLSRVSEEAQRR